MYVTSMYPYFSPCAADVGPVDNVEVSPWNKRYIKDQNNVSHFKSVFGHVKQIDELQHSFM